MRHCRPHSLLLLAFRLLLVAAFLTPLCLHDAFSQQQRDIRLSEDIRELNLREDIRIQAAAELNTTRLVVWGTTVNGSAGSVRNALVFDAGSGQQILHSPEAEPYGQVTIAVLGDRFLVLWNDRRVGGEGIYGRRILADGSFGGEEYLFSLGGKLVDRLYWQNHSGGSTVLWNDRRDDSVSVYLRRLDREGQVIGAEELLGRGGIVENQVSVLPDGRIAFGRGKVDGLIVGVDGEIESEVVPSDRLSFPHYFGGDGSLAVYNVSTKQFLVYKSIYSVEPLWQRDLIFPYYLEPQYGGAVIKERGDTFVVVVPVMYTYTSIGDYAYKYISTESREFYSDADSIVVRRDTLHHSGTSPGVLVLLSSGEYIKECSGESWVTIQVRTINSNYGQTVSESYLYSVNQSGHTVSRETMPILGGCRPLEILGVQRSHSDTLSAVKVVWSSGEAEYKSSTAGYRSTPNIFPVIRSQDDRVTVGWYETELDQLKVKSFAEFPGIVSNTFSLKRPGAKYIESSDSRGGAFLGGDRELETIIGVDGKYYMAYFQQSMHFLWNNSWKNIAFYEDTVYYNTPNFGPYVFSVNYDPNADIVGVAYYHPFGGQQGNYSAVTLSAEDSVIFAIPYDVSWAVRYSFPIDSKSILLINQNGIGRIVGSNSGADITWPSSPLYHPTNYWRLYGSFLLRESRREGTDSVRFDILSIDGKLLHSATFDLFPESTTFFMTQNPADSSIALLYGDSEGVRLTHLKSNLNVVGADQGDPQRNILISAGGRAAHSPAGVIRNDSLFVVWLDEDNQVYANGTTVQKASVEPVISIDDPVVGEASVAYAYPNPASNLVTLHLPLNADRDATVECVDPLGRVGPSHVVENKGDLILLDISELASRSYLIRIHSGSKKLTVKLVVVR